MTTLEEKIKEDTKVYLRVAAKIIPKEYFLDAWWQYLAENKIWVSREELTLPEPKILHLEDLNNTYLYNIRSCVIRVAGDRPGKGALLLIGVITSILNEKAMKAEETGDVPF